MNAETRKAEIKKYLAAHSICQSTNTSKYGYVRYLDGIDMRYMIHATHRAAAIARGKDARELIAYDEFNRTYCIVCNEEIDKCKCECLKDM